MLCVCVRACLRARACPPHAPVVQLLHAIVTLTSPSFKAGVSGSDIPFLLSSPSVKHVHTRLLNGIGAWKGAVPVLSTQFLDADEGDFATGPSFTVDDQCVAVLGKWCVHVWVNSYSRTAACV